MTGPEQAVLDGFKQLRASWPHRGWSYDNRFECVASSFAADFAPEARALLAPIFPYAVTVRNLATTTPVLQALAERTGGIRSAQMIYTAQPVGRLTPYGLWWPWEEAQTISLRIGIEGGNQSHMMQVLECFGVEP